MCNSTHPDFEVSNLGKDEENPGQPERLNPGSTDIPLEMTATAARQTQWGTIEDDELRHVLVQ
jgi:hypothetical protein